MKKTLSLLLAAAMTLSLLAGCGSKTNDSSSQPVDNTSASASQSQQPVDKTDVNFMALSGPTGVGAAYLMKYYSAETSPADCPVALNSTVVADNKEVTDALVNGTADIAAVATNVAANLAAKTDGGIQVLAVNTLGVLYILEKGDSVQSMADLAGKTVYATGQGANPEYVLNYLLTENGVDPAEVDIQWKTADEVAALMASGEAEVCMLPVPAATGVLMKNENVREALDLSAEWDALQNGSRLTMTTIVARTEFIQENPQAVEAFLADYEASVDYVNGDPASASELVARYEITPSAKIAELAIPKCALVCITGADQIKGVIQGYYEVLWQANPQSIGGGIPDDGFYYGG